MNTSAVYPMLNQPKLIFSIYGLLLAHNYRVNIGDDKLNKNIHCEFYCETQKTVNTRNINGMLLCCKEKANQA